MKIIIIATDSHRRTLSNYRTEGELYLVKEISTLSTDQDVAYYQLSKAIIDLKNEATKNNHPTAEIRIKFEDR